jgi:hypothetical protein
VLSRLILIAVVLLGVATPAPASARYMTGLALLDWCKDDGSTFCPGYLAAMADYQSVLQSLDTDTPLFCLPSNVKLGALRTVALDGLGARPQEALADLAATVLLPALARRYPPRGARGCAQRAAAYVDGDTLLDWCKDDASRLCQGYLAGLVDYQDELVRRDTVTPRFCLPGDKRMSDVHALALQVLRANPPREMQKLAASLVIPGFLRAYPCR